MITSAGFFKPSITNQILFYNNIWWCPFVSVTYNSTVHFSSTILAFRLAYKCTTTALVLVKSYILKSENNRWSSIYYSYSVYLHKCFPIYVGILIIAPGIFKWYWKVYSYVHIAIYYYKLDIKENNNAMTVYYINIYMLEIREQTLTRLKLPKYRLQKCCWVNMNMIKMSLTTVSGDISNIHTRKCRV